MRGSQNDAHTVYIIDRYMYMSTVFSGWDGGGGGIVGYWR